MIECKPGVAPVEGRYRRLFLLAEAIEADHFAAAFVRSILSFFRLLRCGLWFSRNGRRFDRRCNNGGRGDALLLGRLIADIGRRLAILAF
ncbi:MAG: hypothetical protein ACREB2_14415, partial [Pseudolabrys sp.]